MDDLTSNSTPSPSEPPATSEAQPPALEPPPPQRNLRGIFVGPTGLIRAGWGIALFIAIFIALGFSVSFLLHHLMHHHRHLGPSALMAPRTAAIGEAAQLLCIIIATAILALVERKSVLAYGFQRPHRAVRFISGLAWGFIAISVLVFALWKSGLLVFDGRLLHGHLIYHYAIAWGIMFLIVGLTEESLLRGYVQYTMTRGIGFWWGALIFSLLFGFGHSGNPGESPVGLFSAGAIGLVFCLSIWYTGSLWWAVGFHAAWDWGESYFYGTSDSGLLAQGHLYGEHPIGKILWSGGATGPEGSLLIVPLLIIMVILMWFWWGRRSQAAFAGQAFRPLWLRKSTTVQPETTSLEGL